VNALWSAAAGCAAALALTPLAGAVARRVGIVDRPGPLKPQQRAVPYMGGVAVAAGVAVGTLLGAGPELLGPPAAAMALGLADDRFDLPVVFRLAGEVAVGAGVALAVHAGHNALLVALSVLGTVSAINGVNLVDGLDGLASGVVGVSAVGFAVLVGGPARPLAAALAGALAGFLVFNRPPARIYLGDAGSYMLGTLLAELLVRAWSAHGSAAPAAVVLLAYPLGELGSSVLRRWRAGRPLSQGDRDHTYDRLAKAGWRTGHVSLVCGAGQAALVGAALGLSTLPPCWAWVTAGAVGTVLAGGAISAGMLGP